MHNLKRISDKKRIREMGADQLYDYIHSLLPKYHANTLSHEEKELLNEAKKQFHQLTGKTF